MEKDKKQWQTKGKKGQKRKDGRMQAIKGRTDIKEKGNRRWKKKEIKVKEGKKDKGRQNQERCR